MVEDVTWSSGRCPCQPRGSEMVLMCQDAEGLSSTCCFRAAPAFPRSLFLETKHLTGPGANGPQHGLQVCSECGAGRVHPSPHRPPEDLLCFDKLACSSAEVEDTRARLRPAVVIMQIDSRESSTILTENLINICHWFIEVVSIHTALLVCPHSMVRHAERITP